MQSRFSDTELIAQTLAGNQQAYSSLVKHHRQFVFTLALRFTRNREDAEEVAQDCFVKAYRSLALFQQNSKFSTWLYTIVYTTAMSFIRKKRITTTCIDDEQNTTQLSSLPGQYENNAENRSRSFYLNQAIAQLLPDDAAIITLFYKGEQSLQEIAQTLCMETNTVKVKLFRARLRLKETLEHNLKHEVKELL